MLRICNSLYVSRFYLKRQKSDCVDSVDGEKDEDLTLLTFQNHKKPKNVQFFSRLMWMVSSIVIQNCDIVAVVH